MKIVQGMVYGVILMVMGIFVLGKTTHISIDNMFDTTAAQQNIARMERMAQDAKKNDEYQKALLCALKDERAMKTILYIMSMHRQEDVDPLITDLKDLVTEDALRDKYGWTKRQELNVMIGSYMAQRDRCVLNIKDKKISDADRALKLQCKEKYEVKIDSAFDQLAQMQEH